MSAAHFLYVVSGMVDIGAKYKNIINIRYDLNNKPVTMNYSDGKKVVLRYNKRGELVELKDWNGMATYTYEKTGQLKNVEDHNGQNIGYLYDDLGNMTEIDYPDGSKVNYAYDKNHRMVKASCEDGKVISYVYDQMGNTKQIAQPGGTTDFRYNSNGLPVSASYQFEDGTHMENSFSYNLSGNIVKIEKRENEAAPVKTTAYTYDALHRLLSCTEDNLTETYGYDAVGNRVLKSINNLPKASCVYNGAGQLKSRIEDGLSYEYKYDKRGNLIEESSNGKVLKQYAYDATNHLYLGKNLERGEETEYGYNALYMRVRSKQTRRNLPDGYKSYAGVADASTAAYATREREYVIDCLSASNNELQMKEKGFGTVKTVFGPGYQRLNQTFTLEEGDRKTARGTVAAAMEKAYFYPDIWGSPLVATNGKGDILRYGERNTWGSLKIPAHDNINAVGLEDNLRFVNYDYDPVIDKYFAQARFYDAKQGRMLAKDPVKRSLVGYSYCDDDPVDYVDPTGEVASILAGGLLGGITGGAFGFIGSVLSQRGNGKAFNMRKALGSAANGAIVGAVRGALVGTGVGIGASFAFNGAAGVAGSALEQIIGDNSLSVGRSLAGGLGNAVSGAIFGNAPLKSVRDAFRRGAAAGAATAGINYLADLYRRNGGLSGRRTGRITRVPRGTAKYVYAYRNPGRGCIRRNPLRIGGSYGRTRGYYDDTRRTYLRRKREGFNLADFGKEVALGAALGGMSSALFYVGGKAVEHARGSIRSVYGGKGGLNSVHNLDDLLSKPQKLTGTSGEELYNYLLKNGYEVKPLGKGSFKGIPFEEGGGFKVNWGGDRILQYHPESLSHHGGAYFKISSGETGTIRIDLDGNLIK